MGGPNKKELSAMLFLHDKGYDFFNIPSLTYNEINYIIMAQNEKVKKEEAGARRAKARRRR